MTGQAVERRVRLRALERSGGRIDRDHVRRLTCEMQRKRTVIAEAVERTTARDRSRELAILALIEKRSRLLASPRRGDIRHAVFAHLDLARYVAEEQLRRPRK